MPPVTRAEAQAETRATLLDAAALEFAAKGFAGASLDGIAYRAGFTRGAIYSNFKDKADLFVTLLDRHLDERFAAIGAKISDVADDPSTIKALHNPRPWKQRRQWMALYDEFRLFAQRNPAARRRLARHEQRLRDSYARAAATVLASADVDAGAFPPDLIGAMLFALDHDLPRQRAIDAAHVSEDLFDDALILLLRAATVLAEGEAPERQTD